MSDYGELCRNLREIKKERHAISYVKNVNKLNNCNFNVEKKNNGMHLVIRHNSKTADYWPSSDKYHIRGSGKYKVGINNLIKELNKVD